MKMNIVFVFLALTLNAKGQEVSNRIDEIRKMYQQITSEKENYSTQIKDITWETFEYNEEDDRSLEKIIRFYCDSNQLKMVIINTRIFSDYSLYKQEIECYYENDAVLFIYLVEEKNDRTSFDPEHSNETVNVIEMRIYFDTSGNCIRYLKKETEGSPDDIDSLRRKSQNIEQDCSEITDFIYETLSILKELPQDC